VRGSFDHTGFYEALDATRQARKLTWKQVAAEAGVSPSTLTRLGQGKRPDVDGLAALVAWSGIDVDPYLRSDARRPEPEPLALITSYLRQDKNLTPEAATALDQLVRATYERLRSVE
jgi:transcriptional regulator with XRE-family HTH domain